MIREQNGVRFVYKITLQKSELLKKPYYYIKNNDVIIVEPNFNKIKSAGFIGSPSSIASISSLLLSITLLIHYTCERPLPARDSGQRVLLTIQRSVSRFHVVERDFRTGESE